MESIEAAISLELKRRNRIDFSDMKNIATELGFSLKEQTRVYRQLVSQQLAVELSLNDQHLVFLSLIEESETYEEKKHLQMIEQLPLIKNQILMCIKHPQVTYDPLTFYVDMGIPYYIQEQCLIALTNERKIFETSKGYEILK